MVVLPTPALAATASMLKPWNPSSARSSRVASMIALCAWALRGRPGLRISCSGSDVVVMLFVVLPPVLPFPLLLVGFGVLRLHQCRVWQKALPSHKNLLLLGNRWHLVNPQALLLSPSQGKELGDRRIGCPGF